MNVAIKDIKILKAIQPQQVTKYLQLKGWKQQHQIADKATIWSRENEAHEPIKVVLPLNPDIPDYLTDALVRFLLCLFQSFPPLL